MILVAIVDDEVEAIVVTWDQVKRGYIPAAFGAVALVRWGWRRYRIGPPACCSVEVPIIRWWVGIRSDQYYVGRHGFVQRADGSFPCPEDRMRRDPRATILPVASKLVARARRHIQVCNEQRWEHWATRWVDTTLGFCRTDRWIDYTCRSGRGRSRNREVTSYGRTGAGFQLSLANTQRHGVFVIVEHIQRERSAAVASHGNLEGSQHLALVKGNVRPRTAANKRIWRRA